MKKNYFNIIIFTFIFGVLHTSDSLPYIEEYVLDNGLRVLISPNYDTPTVAMEVYINAGKLDDPVNKPGLSQRVYDGLYHGTNKFTTSKDLEDAFNDLVGNSWRLRKGLEFDHMFIKLSSVLKNDTENAFELVSEFLRYPTFRKYRGPINTFFKKIFLSLTPKALIKYDLYDEMMDHSVYLLNGFYAPIRPALSVYSKKEVVGWYEKYIRPENITIMISGDINSLYIKKLVNQYFSDWKSNIDMDKRKSYSLKTGNDLSVINRPENFAYVNISFPTTELNEFWSPSIQMALMSFGRIANNRLETIQYNHLNMAGSFELWWNQSNRIPGAGITYYALPYSKVEKFYDTLIEELQKPLEANELEDAKRWRANVYKNARSSGNASLNNHVQYYYNKNGYSIKSVNDLISDINEVTLEEVNAAAKNIFNSQDFKVVVIGSKDSLTTFINKFENIHYFNHKDEINYIRSK